MSQRNSWYGRCVACNRELTATEVTDYSEENIPYCSMGKGCSRYDNGEDLYRINTLLEEEDENDYN